MQSWLKYIFGLLLLLATTPALLANHIIGGEVSYAHISGKKYKVLVKFYRDCNECKFGGNGGGSNTDFCQDIQSFDVLNATTGGLLQTVTLTRDGYEDITPICASAESKCGSNPTINYGIEAHYFSAVVDLSTYTDVCKFEFGIQETARSTDINPDYGVQNFYNYAILDLCNVSSNNSALSKSQPLQVVFVNEPVRYNIESTDPDGDSLSYALKPALISHNKSVVYPQDFDFEHPISVNCDEPCVVDKYATVPKGIFFDEASGELVFVPTVADESGIFVIETTEWRMVNGQWIKIGVSRQDIQLYVFGAINNKPPKLLNTTFDFEICEGQKICRDFSAVNNSSGPDFDTVTFSGFGPVDGVEFDNIAIRNAPYNRGQFCWQTEIGDAREEPYKFTIKLSDNGCPLKKAAYYTLSIKVHPSVSAKNTVENIGCGLVALNAEVDTGNQYNYYWEVRDYKDSSLAYIDVAQSNWQAPYNGLFKFDFFYENTNTKCSKLERTELDIQNLTPIEIVDFDPIEQCIRDTLFINAKTNGGQAPIAYFWYQEPGLSRHIEKIYGDKKVPLKVVDSHGCMDSVEYNVQIYDTLNYNMVDTQICNDSDPLLLNSLLTNTNKAQSLYFYSQSEDSLAIDQNGDGFSLNHKLFESPKRYQIKWTFQDAKGCGYLGEVEVQVNKKPAFDFTPIRPLCANEWAVNLNRETQNSLEGIWRVPNHLPNPINGNNLYLSGIPKDSQMLLEFVYDVGGCKEVVTVSFIKHSLPRVQILQPDFEDYCRSNGTLDLVSNVAGNWSGDGVEGSTFDPDKVTGNHSNILLSYQDEATGCTGWDSLNMTLYWPNEFSFLSERDTICSPETKSIPVQWKQGDASVILEGYVLGIDNYEVKLTPDAYKAMNSFVLLGKTVNDACPDAMDSIYVTVLETPTGQLIVDKYDGCEPLDISLSFDKLNYDLSAINYKLDGEGIERNGLEIKQLLKGAYQYSAEVSHFKCTNTLVSQRIEVRPTPVAGFTINPPQVYADFPVVYVRDVTECDEEYVTHWSFPNHVDSSFYQNDFILEYPGEPGKHQVSLVAVSANGCSDTAKKWFEIQASRELHIPNAFTPNKKGPGANEEFKVVSTVQGTYNIKILNRWGEVIFESNDISEGWDGTYANKPCEPGVYAYRIKVHRNDGYIKEYTGTVSLVRLGE